MDNNTSSSGNGLNNSSLLLELQSGESPAHSVQDKIQSWQERNSAAAADSEVLNANNSAIGADGNEHPLFNSSLPPDLDLSEDSSDLDVPSRLVAGGGGGEQHPLSLKRDGVTGKGCFERTMLYFFNNFLTTR
jgi:hypothetical protein